MLPNKNNEFCNESLIIGKKGKNFENSLIKTNRNFLQFKNAPMKFSKFVLSLKETLVKEITNFEQ